MPSTYWYLPQCELEVMVRVSLLLPILPSLFIDSLMLFDCGKIEENKGELF